MAKMNFQTARAQEIQELILSSCRRWRTYRQLSNDLGLHSRTIRMYVAYMREIKVLRIADWSKETGEGNVARWQPKFGPYVSTRDDVPKPQPISSAEASANYRASAKKSARKRKILQNASKKSTERTKQRNRLALIKNVWDPTTRLAILKGKEDPRPYRKKVTPEVVQRIKDLRDQGMTYQAIGLELGVSRDTAAYHYQKTLRIQQ